MVITAHAHRNGGAYRGFTMLFRATESIFRRNDWENGLPGFYFVKDDDWEHKPERGLGKDVVITDRSLSLPKKGSEKYVIIGLLKKAALIAAAKRRKEHEEMGENDGLTEVDRRLRAFNQENDLRNLKLFKEQARHDFKEYWKTE